MASSLSLSSLFSVAGKVCVVTGGGRGIGEMIARAYVENGARVYITSRQADALSQTASALTKAGPGSCHAIPEDLSTEAGCKRFAAALGEREKELHVLVNNSGISWGAPFERFPEAQWDKIFALNVKSLFLLTRALHGLLKAGSRDGDPARVINIGSIAGVNHQPVPTYSYDASKAAVHALTKKLASELAPSISVNAIAPGFVPSRMSKGLLAYAGEDLIKQGIPMGRMGNAADMGGAAIYLSSRASSWVTGQILVVDGGTVTKPISMLPTGEDASL
jgi:NAD(P)-dependent dehydrogenase (short-subunit alcohol dehydrogenase family)